MELNDDMKALLKDLGIALHQALTKDRSIKEITNEIKGNGYDIYLIMEANIALDKRENGSEGQFYLHSPEDQKDIEELGFNRYDRDFLANLQIRIDED